MKEWSGLCLRLSMRSLVHSLARSSLTYGATRTNIYNPRLLERKDECEKKKKRDICRCVRLEEDETIGT